MGHKKHKIEIASEEEVRKYAGEAPSQDEAARPDDAQTAAESPAAADGESTEAGTGLTTEAQEWKDKCLRARAELANYQKRIEKERIDLIRYANAGLAKSLLPTIDDLERVIGSGQQTPDNAAGLIEGVKLTLENLLKALRELHIERIEAEGKPFDPQVHEAMMEQPSEYPERIVLQELMKGYRLHDRVLRPAKVIVSKPAEPSGTGEQAENEAGGQ